MGEAVTTRKQRKWKQAADLSAGEVIDNGIHFRSPNYCQLQIQSALLAESHHRLMAISFAQRGKCLMMAVMSIYRVFFCSIILLCNTVASCMVIFSNRALCIKIL